MSTEDILAEFGIEQQDDGSIEFTAMRRAETAYVHHSRMPVALAAFAAISPAFARGRFPKTRLVDLVAKRPSMDEDEAVALAEIGGADVQPPFWSNKASFTEHLANVCEHHGLWDVFFLEGGRPALEAFRPLGYHRYEGEDKPALKRFHATIKGLNEGRRMLAATIVTLYRGDAERDMWRKGSWCNWHAADALSIIRGDAQLCADWHKLVALYPGW